MFSLIRSLLGALVLILPLTWTFSGTAVAAIGDSQTCKDVQFPACNGNLACTADITYTEIANVGDACDGQNMVKITVVINCGASGSCNKTILACKGDMAAPSFCCGGARYTTGVSSGTLGGMANGAQRCSTATTACGGAC